MTKRKPTDTPYAVIPIKPDGSKISFPEILDYYPKEMITWEAGEDLKKGDIVIIDGYTGFIKKFKPPAKKK